MRHGPDDTPSYSVGATGATSPGDATVMNDPTTDPANSSAASPFAATHLPSLGIVPVTLCGLPLTEGQTTVLVHSLLCFNQLIYAVYTVWSQFTLRYFSVEFLLFSRMFFASLQIWAASVWLDRRSRAVHDQPFAAVWGGGGSAASSPWRELWKVWVLGAIVFVLNIYMYLSAIKYTNAVVTTVAQCATPVFTSAISIATGAEPFSWLQMFGFLLAIGGNVVQLDVWSTKASGDNYALGIACMFINVISFSVFLIYSKPYMRRLPMLIVYRQMAVVGAMGTLVLTLAVPGPGALRALGTVRDGWAIGGYFFAICIMAYVPYAIVGFAMRCNVPPPLTAAHIIFQPMFTSGIAFVALGTVLKWYQYLGGVLAVLAVSITVWSGMQRLQLALRDQAQDAFSPAAVAVAAAE